MNLAQLQIFFTIIETGGFIAAAEKLHRSQPAITNSIKKLEGRIGFELFDRNHYRPKLTAKGEAFYQKAENVIKNFNQLENSIPILRLGVEAHLSIDLDIALPIMDYTILIQSFIKAYPNTCFTLANRAFVKCLESLQADQCNLCIAATHIQNPNIDYLPLRQITLLPVAGKAYYQQHAALINHPVKNEQCMQIMITDTETELRQLQIAPLSVTMPRWCVGDMYTRKQLILSNMGIGRLPDHLIANELEAGDLVKLDENMYSTVTMDIYAMRLLDREHGVITNHLWDTLKNMHKEIKKA